MRLCLAVFLSKAVVTEVIKEEKKPKVVKPDIKPSTPESVKEKKEGGVSVASGTDPIEATPPGQPEAPPSPPCLIVKVHLVLPARPLSDTCYTNALLFSQNTLLVLIFSTFLFEMMNLNMQSNLTSRQKRDPIVFSSHSIFNGKVVMEDVI